MDSEDDALSLSSGDDDNILQESEDSDGEDGTSPNIPFPPPPS